MFYKDIWSLIFNVLEFDLDFHTLNTLSLTCKKLYKLDRERQRNYQKELGENFLIAPILEPYRRHRVYLCIVKYMDLALLDIKTYKKSKEVENTFLYKFPQLFYYFHLLDIKTYEDLKNVKDFSRLAEAIDISLVCNETGATELVSAFLLWKHDQDIVYSIMEYKDPYISSFQI